MIYHEKEVGSQALQYLLPQCSPVVLSWAEHVIIASCEISYSQPNTAFARHDPQIAGTIKMTGWHCLALNYEVIRGQKHSDTLTS